MNRISYDREKLTTREAQIVDALIAVHLSALALTLGENTGEGALYSAAALFEATLPDLNFRVTEVASTQAQRDGDLDDGS
jgi:hypothetical protein